MHQIRIDRLSTEQHAELGRVDWTADDGRLRMRALIVLLVAERGIVAVDIAAAVRGREETVRRWLTRCQAEGLGWNAQGCATPGGSLAQHAHVPRPVVCGGSTPSACPRPAIRSLEGRPARDPRPERDMPGVACTDRRRRATVRGNGRCSRAPTVRQVSG